MTEKSIFQLYETFSLIIYMSDCFSLGINGLFEVPEQKKTDIRTKQREEHQVGGRCCLMKSTFQKIDIPSGYCGNTIKKSLMVKRPDGLYL